MLWVRGIWERARIEPYLSVAECDLVQQSLPAWQKAYAAGLAGDPRRAGEDRRRAGGQHDAHRRLRRPRSPGVRSSRFRDAGVDEISLRLYDEPDVAIRLIAERVVPAL